MAGFGANQCRKIDSAPEVRRFVVARAPNTFGRFTAGAAGFLNSYSLTYGKASAVIDAAAAAAPSGTGR